MSNFIVTMDAVAFEAEVQKYVVLSPVFKEWGDVRKLKWPQALVPPALWTTFPELLQFVGAVCTAVELAKQEIIKQNDPDGSKGAKFDREIALSTAVKIIAAGLKFSGVWGLIFNRAWLPIINVLVSVWVSQQSGAWATVAAGTILKLAVVL